MTTVDPNDATGPDDPIPWEWLEGFDHGLVEELERFEDGGLEG